MDFLDRVSKNPLILNLLKIRLVRTELSHADGQADGQTDRQTDMTKLIVAFSNFAMAPKKGADSKIFA